MLSENIRRMRNERGLSQEELARRLHVVRQTISKWEQGLSVPDAQMLLRLAEELEVSVPMLLGEGNDSQEKREEAEQKTVQELAATLGKINDALAQQEEKRRKRWHILCLALLVILGLYTVYLAAGFFYSRHMMAMLQADQASIGIIGGSDGPTQILVAAGSVQGINVFLLAVLIGALVVGLIKTRRK